MCRPAPSLPRTRPSTTACSTTSTRSIPDIVEDVDTSYVVGNLFEGLYNEDAKGNPVPGAAESYDVNADFTVYTFHLRDAKWSNGDPVKASDFVYGWQRAVDPKTASNYSYFLGLVGVKNADDIVAGKLPITDLGVKAIDDKTLEVTLDKPVPYFVRTHGARDAVPGAPGRRREVRRRLDQAGKHRRQRRLYARRKLARRTRHAEAQPELLG